MGNTAIVDSKNLDEAAICRLIAEKLNENGFSDIDLSRVLLVSRNRGIAKAFAYSENPDPAIRNLVVKLNTKAPAPSKNEGSVYSKINENEAPYIFGSFQDYFASEERPGSLKDYEKAWLEKEGFTVKNAYYYGLRCYVNGIAYTYFFFIKDQRKLQAVKKVLPDCLLSIQELAA